MNTTVDGFDERDAVVSVRKYSAIENQRNSRDVNLGGLACEAPCRSLRRVRYKEKNVRLLAVRGGREFLLLRYCAACDTFFGELPKFARGNAVDRIRPDGTDPWGECQRSECGRCCFELQMLFW